MKTGKMRDGKCIACLGKERVQALIELRNLQPARRTVRKNGYVMLSERMVDPNDLPMFRQMAQRERSYVFEHRWAMAKHIGRALHSYELVDHMDGNKQNNDVSNLRIYIRGKNHPGSSAGHGTYYHEWQMAERRIRELEAQLAAS